MRFVAQSKYYIPLFFMFFTLSFCKAARGQGENSNSIKYYQLRACKLTFKFSNGLQEGDKVLIFNDSGVFEKVHVYAHALNKSLNGDSVVAALTKNEVTVLMIKTPKSVYTIDLKSKKGRKEHRSPVLWGNESAFLKKRLIGEDTVLGRLCDVYECDGGFKVWYWKGIALRKEMVIDGTPVFERIMAIDEHYLIKKDEFAVPIGVALQDH